MAMKPMTTFRNVLIASFFVITCLVIKHITGELSFIRDVLSRTDRLDAIKHRTCNSCQPDLFFDYIEEMRQLNEAKVRQDDPRLIKLIRDYYILPPSLEEYRLKNINKSDYAGQGKDNMIPQLLTDVPEKGLFIDCGAYDGEDMSHTLYFEKTKHWSGLLIEADPDVFRQLRAKNRKSYTMNACLNTQPYPAVMTFNLFPGLGKIIEGSVQDAYKHHPGLKAKEKLLKVQCFPLYSVLLAMGQTHVDFFSLDVEGNELEILKTIPWDKVDITYLLAEFSHDEGGKPPMQQYLEANGYKTIKEFKEDILVKKT